MGILKSTACWLILSLFDNPSEGMDTWVMQARLLLFVCQSHWQDTSNVPSHDFKQANAPPHDFSARSPAQKAIMVHCIKAVPSVTTCNNLPSVFTWP